MCISSAVQCLFTASFLCVKGRKQDSRRYRRQADREMIAISNSLHLDYNLFCAGFYIVVVAVMKSEV